MYNGHLAQMDDVTEKGGNVTDEERWKEKGRKEVENHGEDLTGTL
jgi:hypothetical protein